MSSILFRNGVVHSSADPFAEAVLIEDGVVTWLGADDSAAGFVSRADEVVDLDGLLVTPAFVDAHVHLLATGLALEGLDLSAAAGVQGAADLLSAVSQQVAARSANEGGEAGAPSRASEARETRILYGHGWDESTWTDPALPTLAALDAASGGAPVLLVRADVHSSLVSSALAELLGLGGYPGWTTSGHVTGQAHDRALAALTEMDQARHRHLTDLALGQAARAGIVSVHEMAAPGLETRAGLADLIARTAQASSALPHVIGYWGELCETAADAANIAAAIPGLSGIGGDLRVDGSLGSHTAALSSPYADLTAREDPQRFGHLELTADQIAQHIVAVSEANLPTAFHVIGDAAMHEVIAGFTAAANAIGDGAIRALGHRLEHAEMIDAASLATLVLLGVHLSMQPAFDDEWGRPDGLYETRLGRARAGNMNPFADIAGAGIPLAFGSDSPVTPLDPWRGVRSALLANASEQRVTARAAFRAHTRGGWRLAGLDHTGAGEIRVGSPAHLAFWDAPRLAVQGPERMFSSWSTDARAGIALLPDLAPDSVAPRCVRTMRAGVVLHDEIG